MKAQVKRLTPSADTIKKLLLRSGNRCAFPGCMDVIFDDQDRLLGECCHIEAAMPGGERFNESQSEEDRRSFENLIFLCHRHHVETNDVQQFPVSILKQIKRDHEALFSENLFAVNARKVEQVEVFFERLASDMAQALHHVKQIDSKIDAISQSINAIPFQTSKNSPVEYYGPPTAIFFTGRELELKELAEVSSLYNTFLVEGIPGIGKSIFLAHYLNTIPTGPTLWIDCNIVTTCAQLFDYLGKFLLQEFDDRSVIEGQKASDSEIWRIATNSLQNFPCRLVLNALNESQKELVHALSLFNKYLQNSKIFVSTSHSLDTIEWANPVHRTTLSGLSISAFTALAKQLQIPTLAFQAIPRLHALLNGHPFLLKLTAGTFRFQSVSKVISGIEAQSIGKINDYIRQGVLHSLTSEEKTLISILANYALPIRFEIGEFIPAINFTVAFQGLQSKFLLEQYGEDLYRAPEYVSNLIFSTSTLEEREIASSILVDYLHSLKPKRVFEQRALINHALILKQIELARTEVSSFLNDLLACGEFKLANEFAKQFENEAEFRDWSLPLFIQGRVMRFQENYRQALELYSKGLQVSNSERQQKSLEFERASILVYLSKVDQDQNLMDQAISIYTKLANDSDPTMAVQCELSISCIEIQAGQFEKVVSRLRTLTDTIDYTQIQSNVLAGLWQLLGDAYTKTKEYNKAFTAFDRSIDFYYLALENFGLQVVDGLYHLYESYGWTYALAEDFPGAVELFRLCLGLCDQYDLGLKKESALFNLGYNLVLSGRFTDAIPILSEHYGLFISVPEAHQRRLPFIFGTLAFAHWYGGELVTATELLGLFILASYQANKQPTIAMFEEDGITEPVDIIKFFRNQMYIFIIPTGSTFETFQSWVSTVAAKRPELQAPLMSYMQFSKPDSPA